MRWCILFSVFLLLGCVNCDVYLHMIRGSNNRLDEANRDRANGDRLFDSQNNNRGGYNVGSSWYYAGEEAYIEWTNQHGCGSNPNTHCELVVQYMCDPLLRDGTTTQRIPDQEEADVDYRFGRQESYEWYQACKQRQRNGGLFTASQNLRGTGAIYTRQNPNGNRRGFECPEERDYYPYWHPTPWRDALILTDQPDRNCEMYRTESQNVRNKGYCVSNLTRKAIHGPNNPLSCQNTTLPPVNVSVGEGNITIVRNDTAVWAEFGAFNIDAPECREAPWSRDNHLGNGVGGQPLNIRWTVPDNVDEQCAFRLRYNISTSDYDGWDSRFNSSLNDQTGEALMRVIGEQYGITDPVGSGYLFENNPEVNIGLDANLVFELAINTAQYGRTFQDRSHRFGIRPRPDNTKDIRSLNVRGKRGNIVQVYPGVEYDFVPNIMEITTRTWVHAQWTGSNTNPANNDGQGRQQSDRSNLAEIKTMGGTYPQHLRDATLPNATEFHPYTVKHYMSRLHLNTAGGEMSELDDASTFYEAGLVRFSKTGTYNYMCTRNNNFSNRGQKASIVVSDGSSDDDGLSTAIIIGIVVGSVAAVALITAAVVGSAIYFRKQAKIARREGQVPIDDDVNPFSPVDDS